MSPRHGKQTPTTSHPPPVLSLLTSGSSRLGVKYFLIVLILISFGGCLVVAFLVLVPGLFLSVQVLVWIWVDLKEEKWKLFWCWSLSLSTSQLLSILSLFVFFSALRSLSLLLFSGGAWLVPLSLNPDFRCLWCKRGICSKHIFCRGPHKGIYSVKLSIEYFEWSIHKFSTIVTGYI